MGNSQSKSDSDSESKSESKKVKAKPTIKGYARRKGEHNPKNYGWAITDELAADPRWKDSTELPPVGGFKKDKDGLTKPQRDKIHAKGFEEGWAMALAQQRAGGGGAGFMQPGGGFAGTSSQQPSR